MSARRLALFVAADFGLVQAVVMLGFHARFDDTGLAPIAWFVEGRQGGDSWAPMAQAYGQALAPHHLDRPFYWRTFFDPTLLRKGFQYPPTALLIVSGLHAAVGDAWEAVVHAITWAMVPLTAFFLWRTYEALRPRAPPPPRDRWTALAAAAIATLTFYPVMRAYANGQVQAWLNALFAAAVWAWVTGRPGGAGALLALSCAVKPQLGVFLIWGLLRRQWRFLGTFAAVGATLLLLSLALYGWSAHVEYLEVLRFLGERGEAYFPNQSVNGLLNRWRFEEDILLWKKPWIEHFPPYDARVFVPTVVSSLVLLAVGLVAPADPGARGGALDFCLMGLVATMASPIAWEHHYGVALPIFVVVLLSGAAEEGHAQERWAIAVSYVLVANCFWVTKALADTRLEVLESYLFFGAIVLLVVAVRRRARA